MFGRVIAVASSIVEIGIFFAAGGLLVVGLLGLR